MDLTAVRDLDSGLEGELAEYVKSRRQPMRSLAQLPEKPVKHRAKPAKKARRKAVQAARRRNR